MDDWTLETMKTWKFENANFEKSDWFDFVNLLVKCICWDGLVSWFGNV